jgi:4-aminobutyrate aminotransferase-like enzyme
VNYDHFLKTEVIQREKLCEKSMQLGKILLKSLKEEQTKYPFLKKVRGRGLLTAIELDPKHHKSAWYVL